MNTPNQETQEQVAELRRIISFVVIIALQNIIWPVLMSVAAILAMNICLIRHFNYNYCFCAVIALSIIVLLLPTWISVNRINCAIWLKTLLGVFSCGFNLSLFLYSVFTLSCMYNRDCP